MQDANRIFNVAAWILVVPATLFLLKCLFMDMILTARGCMLQPPQEDIHVRYTKGCMMSYSVHRDISPKPSKT